MDEDDVWHEMLLNQHDGDVHPDLNPVIAGICVGIIYGVALIIDYWNR